MDGMKVDRWVRQLTLMAMLLAALALLVMGIALYGSRTHAQSHDPSRCTGYAMTQSEEEAQ